jgi:isopentenyl-diphosphate Delta-isomerase
MLSHALENLLTLHGFPISMAEEQVDLVDEENNVVRQRPLRKCLAHGLLHRAVIVFVRDSKGRVYLQQRSLSDGWLPGMWTASCTGHVRSGETPYEAAERDVKEELGINGRPAFLFKFHVPEIIYYEKRERELSFVFELVSDGPISPNVDEVEKMKLLTMEECAAFLIAHEKEVTLDAKLAFERYSTKRGT